MDRIKRPRVLGCLLLALVLIGLGLLPKTYNPPNTQATELPIFRDLFKPLIRPSPKRPPKEMIEPAPAKTEENQSLSSPPFTNSSLRLVGVVMGSPPIAILENISNRLSHIAKEGNIVNDEEIVVIKETSVIVRKDGQEIILRVWEEQVFP